ncbi:MAG: sugar porter family MFS transporter [Gammaproteobacteria bacterium]|nr:sugar porter family MFS transporter [Gammaproteobacteria bacterium]
MQNDNKQNKLILWIAGLVSVGGILYGYDMGVISGALLFIKDAIPMTDTQVGLIVGAVLGGGLFGTLLAGPLGDWYGRRFLIAASAIIFIIGIALVLFANTFLLMFSARLFLGVGVGMVAVAVPLYVAEIVPSKDRGKFITFFQLLLTFGIVLAYVVDLIFTPTGNWRAMFAVILIPAFILLFGILRLPETPRWLMANNQAEKARKILALIRNHESEVEEDMRAIEASLHKVQGSWQEFFSHQFWGPCIIAVLVAVFNQLTGINSFLQYAPLILKDAGMSSNFVTMVGSVGIGLLNFVFTIVAITLIDTLGRRPLLLIGVFGVMASEIYLGAISYFLPVSPHVGTLALIGLFFFIMFFAIGPGVVVWLAISELFPTRVRGKGIAICLFFNSLAATALSVYFLPIVKYLGMGQTYWAFAFLSACYFLIVLYLLPETKARSLEEIQQNFEDKRNDKLNKKLHLENRQCEKA